eukprot:scaffold1646_cov69-Skeletonema_menzelii.AAC.1
MSQTNRQMNPKRQSKKWRKKSPVHGPGKTSNIDDGISIATNDDNNSIAARATASEVATSDNDFSLSTTANPPYTDQTAELLKNLYGEDAAPILLGQEFFMQPPNKSTWPRMLHAVDNAEEGKKRKCEEAVSTVLNPNDLQILNATNAKIFIEKNPYTFLGVPQDATDEDILGAFRQRELDLQAFQEVYPLLRSCKNTLVDSNSRNEIDCLILKATEIRSAEAEVATSKASSKAASSMDSYLQPKTKKKVAPAPEKSIVESSSQPKRKAQPVQSTLDPFVDAFKKKRSGSDTSKQFDKAMSRQTDASKTKAVQQSSGNSKRRRSKAGNAPEGGAGQGGPGMKVQLPAAARQQQRQQQQAPQQGTDNSYPTRKERSMLMEKAGIDSTQLTNWFANARKRKDQNSKKKQEEVAKMAATILSEAGPPTPKKYKTSTRCQFVNDDGRQCRKESTLRSLNGLACKLTCKSCISKNWESDPNIVKQEGSLRLRNVNYDHDTADISLHQETVQLIVALLRDCGVEVEDDDVAGFLLNYFQTESWEVDLAALQPNKRKPLPYILYFLQKQTLSLVETVAALIAAEYLHQEEKSKKKKQQKERRESGLDSSYCSSCIGTGTLKKIVTPWSKLKHKYAFRCTSCMNEALKSLAETNTHLSIIPIGIGIFMYKNPIYDASSEDAFCGEEFHYLDLNNSKSRRPAVFPLLATGAVPSTNDTTFQDTVNQMEVEYEQHLIKNRDNMRQYYKSLSRDQAEVLAKLGNNVPSLTQDNVDQETKRLGSFLDGALPKVKGNGPTLVMCNASSSNAEIIDGRLVTSRVDNEQFRKLVCTDSTILLLSNGATPSVSDFTIVTVSDASEINVTETEGICQVIVYEPAGAVDQASVRMMEEAGIKTIQMKAKKFSGIISTEHPTSYFPGSISDKYLLGQATVVIVSGFLASVMSGKLFLNANLTQFLKLQIMNTVSELRDPKYWKLAGDDLTLAQRLEKMTLGGSLSSLAPVQQQQMIMMQQTRRQTAKQVRKEQALKKRDTNARPEVEDGDRGDKKQRAIPSECLGKDRLVMSGSVGDRDEIISELEAHESWLGLKVRTQFPGNIRERAHKYIFVCGEGASQKKVTAAKQNGITTWSPEQLTEFLAKLAKL